MEYLNPVILPRKLVCQLACAIRRIIIYNQDMQGGRLLQDQFNQAFESFVLVKRGNDDECEFGQGRFGHLHAAFEGIGQDDYTLAGGERQTKPFVK